MADALEDLDDDDLNDSNDSPTIRELRSKNRDLAKKAKRVDELEEELTSYKRKDAIAGADLQLNEHQREALEAAHKGEWTKDAVRAAAVRLGWAEETEEERQLPDELEAQDRIAGAAAGARPGSAGVVTPDDVAGWSTEKAIRFSRKYPQEWEGLKRGEEAVGITF